MKTLYRLSLVLPFAMFLLFPIIGTPGASATNNCSFTTVGTVMMLNGDCTTDSTILIPNGFTLDGAGHTITAVDPPAGHFLGAVVKNAGATANVMNLRISTSGLANVCDGGANRLRGILFESASGSITNNTVLNINQGASGCQEGNAIEARNPPFDGTHPATKSVTITGNTIDNYQKTGILVNGDVDGTIHNNTVSGLGMVPFIAQNGIQVGFGATASVKRNAVSDNWYTGADFASTGVLLFQVSDVTAEGNTASQNQVGVAVETWCFLGGPVSASDNHVVRNTINGAQLGVSVHSFSFFSSCNPDASNNKVVNNSISTSVTPVGPGVSVGAFDLDIPSPDFTPSAVNNKVIANTIIGHTPPIDTSAATKTKVQANRP